MRENGISHERYATMSDQEVQIAVAEVKRNHPNFGEVMMQRHLQSRGLILQRHRVGRAIHAVDPKGVKAKKASCSKTERVFSPLSELSAAD